MMARMTTRSLVHSTAVIAFVVAAHSAAAQSGARFRDYDFDDSHFHLTNYIQEGTDIRDFVRLMGTRVGRSTLFGIPLQQTWSHENSGDYAPT